MVNIDEMILDEMESLRKKRSPDDYDYDYDFMGEDFNTGFRKEDYSAGSDYPKKYCPKVSNLTTECFEESLLELWANEGAFDEVADKTIAGLTKKSILERINRGNYR